MNISSLYVENVAQKKGKINEKKKTSLVFYSRRSHPRNTLLDIYAAINLIFLQTLPKKNNSFW